MFDSSVHGNGTVISIDENVFLDSVVPVFGKKGFSNTNYSELANALNVPEAKLRQVYADKEDLFVDMCKRALLKLYAPANETNPVKAINAFIDSLKIEVQEQSVYAEVIDLMLNSKDIPDYSMMKLTEVMVTSCLGDAFRHAQKRGYICGGNLKDVLCRFISSSYILMKGYVKAGLAIPDNELFLSIISFKETPDVLYDSDIMKQKNAVIAAFAEDFQNILFVDLDTDKVDVYQGEEDDPWVELITHKGFDEFTKQYTEKYVAPEEKDSFLKEMNPENIKMRLDEDPIYYVEHKLIMNGELIPYQTKIVLDPMYAYGNRVLVGSHRVYR